MNDKEFVLVSQGMEIMRTKSQENAINYVKKENDEWFNYKQKCIDNYEDYADNYIDLEIEYPEDKRYLQLQSNWNSLREWIEKNIKEKPLLTTYFFECDGKQKSISTIELEELKRVLDKMNELESSDNK